MNTSPGRAALLLRGASLAALLVPAFLLLRGESSLTGFLVSLACIAGLWLVAAFLTARFALASVLTGVFLALLFAAGAIKHSLLSLPLLATDIYFLPQLPANITILYRYPAFAIPLMLGIAIAAILIVAVARTGLRRRRNPVALLAGVALLAPSLLPSSAPTGDSDPFARPLDAWRFFSGDGNTLSRFLLSFRRMGVSVPPRSSGADPSADFAGAPQLPAPAQLPDIILWHDESTIDPALIAACDAPQCQSSLFTPDNRTAAAGLLATHIFGGFSCTSEFAVLTGLDHRTFGPGGIYSHITLAPRIATSLPRVLKGHGYRSIALYPNARNFLNAAAAYRDYGFDRFLAASDLGLPADPWLVTDDMMRRHLVRLFPPGDRGRQPVFAYVLTQFQHEPHDQPLAALPEPYRSLRFPAIEAPASISLVNYLYRLRQTEETIEAVDRDYLRAPGARPTMLVHYGDHQPTLDGAMPRLAKRGLDVVPPELRHLIANFKIAANFPPAARESHPYLDIAFLPGLILDTAGIPGDAFFLASSRLRRFCDGRYLSCPDRPRIARFHDYVFHQLHAVR